jgi:uncharacterized membrane protein YagU involved in acid resistance
MARGPGELERRGSEREDDTAAVRASRAVAEPLLGRRLTHHEAERGGILAHYLMGKSSGALYGTVAELVPGIAAGRGVPFGLAVWLVADEGIVPLAGLSKKPTEYGSATHLHAAVSHLVYGLATDVVRRTVRRML